MHLSFLFLNSELYTLASMLLYTSAALINDTELSIINYHRLPGKHEVRVDYTHSMSLVPDSDWKSMVSDMLSKATLSLSWEPDPLKLKIYIYSIPSYMNLDLRQTYDKYCEKSMFRAEILFHDQVCTSKLMSICLV